MVFFDLRKAFDTVNHLLLFNELCKIGCSDSCVNWFRHYLTDRSQVTVIPGADTNSSMSSERPISCGVPQGSVLGPLLFNIYINSIVGSLSHSDYYMYADDLAILVGNRDPLIVQALLQSDVLSLSRWCDEHMLTVNSCKTHVMWCHSAGDVRNFGDYEISLKQQKLRVVSAFNYLGVLIDSTLSFEPHCTRVLKSAKVKLSQLRRLKKHMDTPLALLLYKQMIVPSLEYCTFIYESGPEGFCKELQTVQNHCLRCCLEIVDPRLIRINDLHERCECRELSYRRRRSVLNLMYKHSRKGDNLIVPSRVLRSNALLKFKLQRPKGELYRKSPLYKGVCFWNELDAETQNASTIEIFMSKI